MASPAPRARRAAPNASRPAGAVDAGEIERFDRLAADWWDPEGPMRGLHRLNPLRLGYIRDRLCAARGRDPLKAKPLAGLRLLDMGCGAGVLSEPLARLGAQVVGADASEPGILAARSHAARMELAIDYRVATAAELVAAGESFDAVLAMEILEHVPDTDAFLADLGRLAAPNGELVLATLNRTPKAFALAIVGAEYLLRWVPRGTHDWRKFVRPSELARGLRGAGFRLADVTGVIYDPLSGDFRLSRDSAVNYLAFATR